MSASNLTLSSLIVVRERDDGFTGLFGPGRGVPGRNRASAAPASSGSLLELLLGATSMPAGLALLAGDIGGGKTVAAAFMASQLAASGLHVYYLDADGSDRTRALLDAQPAGTEILLSHPSSVVAGADIASGIIRNGAQVLIIDSLPNLFHANDDRFRRDVRELAAAARKRKVAVLGTCPLEALAPASRTGAMLRAQAPSPLQVRRSDSCTSPAGWDVFEVSDDAHTRSASLQVDFAPFLT